MAFKSIIAVASGLGSDAALLRAAAELATRSSAQVRVLPAYPDPAADLIYFGAAINGAPEGARERVRESEREQQQQLERLVADAAARAGIGAGSEASLKAEPRPPLPAAALAEATVLADLVMFAGDAVRDPFVLGAPFADTLLEARAPVLIVKDDQFSLGAVAIAWDGSAQAGRAVRAATSLLKLADEVVILQNVGDLSAQTRIPAPPDALKAYLALQGVKRTTVRTVEGGNVAESLVRGAHEAGCAILVAGGYGRPRLYELALGGTTRALVNAADNLHLFLAH